MASERRRIAEQIRPGESVFIPFAGAGPYAIPAAAQGAEVITVEISHPACLWMTLNASISNASLNLQIIQGDALQIVHSMKRKFSRVIIPTPYGLIKKPDIFLSLLSTQGIAHWITFCNKIEISRKVNDLTEQGHHVMRCHQCGNVAPSISRWILDIISE